MNANAKWAMGGFGLAAMLGMGLAMGPLIPPAGPVTDTAPSLAELEAKIDAIGLPTSSVQWQTVLIVARDQADARSAVLVAPGRVEVRSTTAHLCAVSLFDEPGGAVDSVGLPVNGATAFHHNYNYWDTGSNRAPSHIQLNTIVEDGLYLAYTSFSPFAVVQVQYRELD